MIYHKLLRETKLWGDLSLRLSRQRCLYEARTSLWFCPRPCRGERDWLCSIFYWCLHLCNLSNVFNHGLLRRFLHATHIYWSFKRVACIWGNQMLVQSNLSKFCHWDCKWPKTWSKAWSKTWSKTWLRAICQSFVTEISWLLLMAWDLVHAGTLGKGLPANDPTLDLLFASSEAVKSILPERLCQNCLNQPTNFSKLCHWDGSFGFDLWSKWSGDLTR